ncbi:MAG: ATP-dependent DNA helicase RecG [Luteolibacter sp.]
MISATHKLATLPLVSAKEVMSFASAGITTVAAMIEHLPKRYEDRRRFDSFPTQAKSDPVCLRGRVVDTSLRHLGHDRRFYEVIVMDESGGVFGSGKITCRWFNMPFMKNLVATGHEVVVYGRIKEANGKLLADHPEIEVIRDEDASIHLERMVPIYRNISGIAQRRLREIIYSLISQIDPQSLDWIYDVDQISSKTTALGALHFPESMDSVKSVRRQFAFEELLVVQLNAAWRKSKYRENIGRVLGKNVAYLKQFHASLPFELTDAQKRSIREIAADMRSERPMNRLLQGDVGSGKTFVAMAAMLLAIGSGSQAALMAPTQILAEQHYLTFRRWLDPLGIKIRLRTGNRDEDNSTDGKPQITIGTHALLYESVLFEDLGLVVIDEQHKFGVAQRASLIRQGVVPDVLVMTATPIPRTLTMTIYGDLDVSLLDEKPPGRARVITAMRVAAKQIDVTRFVKDQLSQGRQAYLVYPLVEESENLKVESATEAFQKWQKRLKTYEVGLIHGKLRPEEKQAVMERFRCGEIDALVATTVIEVGVDVPNASVMILHHAERFGLAQLHQLRGRIGRGGHKGYCVLLTDGKNPDALEKLDVLVKSSDGFEIAEADLRLRGPGNVLGTIQSGLSGLKFPDFLTDFSLLVAARQHADLILGEDPKLEGIHRKLRRLIDEPASGVNLPSTA